MAATRDNRLVKLTFAPAHQYDIRAQSSAAARRPEANRRRVNRPRAGEKPKCIPGLRRTQVNRKRLSHDKRAPAPELTASISINYRLCFQA